MKVRDVKPLRSTGILLAALIGQATLWPVPAIAACDITRPDVRFYCGDTGLGYTIEDRGPQKLLTVFQQAGGEAVLGRVASQPFKDARFPGYVFQATERFVLQLKDSPDADPKRDGGVMNVLDFGASEANAQWDAVLIARYGIPKASPWPGDVGRTPAQVAAFHMQTVFGGVAVDPSLRRVADALQGYLTGNGNYTLLGLPTSPMQRSTINGQSRVCVRLQRAGLCWRDELGAVVPEYAGAELVKTVGIFHPEPTTAFDPAPPPGAVGVELLDTNQTINVYEPLPGPLALMCARVPGIPTCAPNGYVAQAQLYAEGLNGREQPGSLEGLSLNITIRDASTGALLIDNKSLPLKAGPTVALAELNPATSTDYDLEVHLTGKYRGVANPPAESRGRVRLAFHPYARLAALPLPVAFGLLTILCVVSAVVLARSVIAVARQRSALPTPTYRVLVAGVARTLDSFRDKEFRLARWLLGTVQISGRDLGAPGLRFGLLEGHPAIAGRGRMNGKPISRLRGTPLAPGTTVELPDGRSVVIAGGQTSPLVQAHARPLEPARNAEPTSSSIGRKRATTSGTKLGRRAVTARTGRYF